ncbi:hypothetical protein RhiirA4_471401 [Rhizophagus irregularis]|uniref:Uncharacterized protein n=1 Tax=Rhizophagus irregularis TaxID=588596 RepID=A0A2I1H351_9GLOM|nr:hypothetical protein RhiirA4_471401 [Rhizophagus irregularis]
MSERWVDLYTVCPGRGCNNETPSYWVHSVDSYRTQISNHGRIKCTGCSTVDYMKNWDFACSKHSGEYRPTSSISFGKALFIASNNVGMDDDFIDDLSRYLRKNKWDYGLR